MAQLDLSDYRRRFFGLGADLRESEAPRVRFAYRGHRLAPVAGLSREWLVATLHVPEAEAPRVEPLPPPVDATVEAPADQDALTDVLDGVEPVADPPAPPPPEPALSPVAATLFDALALQMWLVDVLLVRDFQLERLEADDGAALEAVSLELISLEERLTEISATGSAPAEIRDALRKLGRELSSLATFAEVTLGNLSIGLESDLARLDRGESPAELELPEPERARPDKPAAPRPAPAGGGEAVKLGRVKVRFSSKELRVLRVVAFGVMPLVIAAVVAVQTLRHPAPRGGADDAQRILSTVDGRAVGTSYVIRLSSFSDFDADRARLLELTKAVASAGYESARFEYGGRTVAVWEQGHLRAGS